MSIRVNDPAMAHLPDEVSVVISDGTEGLEDPTSRIVIHPWAKGRWAYSRNRRVSVTLGYLRKDGSPKKDEADNPYEIGSFDREEFVEGLLAVFPELRRVES